MGRFFFGTPFLRSLLDFFLPCFWQGPFIICFGGEEESRPPQLTTPPVGPGNDEPHHNATSLFFCLALLRQARLQRSPTCAHTLPPSLPLTDRLFLRQLLYGGLCLAAMS
jgi:hypothetical protein